MPYKDPEVQKAYDRLKYQRNREKRLKQVREYRATHSQEAAEWQREYRKKNAEKSNTYKRHWRSYQSPEAKERERITAREWRRNNPDKAKLYYETYIAKNKTKHIAHWMMRAAIHCGYMVKPTACENCGAEAVIHAHHIDYSKVFEVEWLCHACHVKAHNGSFRNPPISITGRFVQPSSE